MHEHYFHVLNKGLAGELERLPLDEALDHLDNHLAHFLLDGAVSGCYAGRLGRDPGLAASPRGRAALAYTLSKRVQQQPFDATCLRPLGRLLNRQDLEVRADFLASLNAEPEGLDDILALNGPGERLEGGPVLRSLLKVYPSYVQAADLLLELDQEQGQGPGDWLKLFRCPGPVEAQWRARLFSHWAALGRQAEALALWPGLEASAGECLWNQAAALHLASGREAQARACLEKSLALDPRQVPLRLRLAEMDRPTPLRPELLRQRRVVVCIYSFNKAPVLEATLCSLAATDLGSARLRLLLNGCTDRSREVAESARKLFPDNEFQVLDLPVNVGAPAARNWLAALPECREADYVAYLDDDVELPRDWLARFLSVAEEDEGIGVVGCKVLEPGAPARIQYLYRNVALARPDMFKLIMHAPPGATDNGLYDFTRRTMSVMGCCHLLRGKALREVPGFDIRFSPSQGDDIEHDLAVCLAGWSVVYTGRVACVHHQNSGVSWKPSAAITRARAGNVIGNDIKLCAKHAGNLERLRELALADRRRAESGADWRGRA